MMRWYVVQTKPGREALAESHLKRQGFDTYLPRYSRQISHARKRQLVKAPLFPGYLFVHMDTGVSRWRAIDGTIGAIGVVRFGERPSALADDIVEEIRQRENQNGLVELVRADDLTNGDLVAVEHGPMSGMNGIFMTAKDADRVVVLFKLMGRNVSATVKSKELRKAV